AMRYIDPETQIAETVTMNHLTRQPPTGVWRTVQGVDLRLLLEDVPVLGSVNAAKVFYQGQGALENLAKFVTGPDRSRIVLHPALQIEVDPTPLKLNSVSIGKKGEK